jgi:hypothetical protein
MSESELHLFEIRGAKHRITAALLRLRDASGISFELPTSVTEKVFYNEDQAAEKSGFEELARSLDGIP